MMNHGKVTDGTFVYFFSVKLLKLLCGKENKNKSRKSFQLYSYAYILSETLGSEILGCKTLAMGYLCTTQSANWQILPFRVGLVTHRRLHFGKSADAPKVP